MKINKKQLRKIIIKEFLREQSSKVTEALPGQLRVATPPGETSTSTSDIKKDIELEITNTTAQINTIKDEDSASQSQKKILQQQLAMLQTKLSDITS